MSDWITWYQCSNCGHSESKLKKFEKIGKIEVEDGRKITHYRCPACKGEFPRETLHRCVNTLLLHGLLALNPIPSATREES